MRIWQKIGLRLRQFGLEAYAFLTAPFVMRNCLGMVLAMAAIFFLSFWWLHCYTNHGESVQVPNYVGMSFREAAKKARARDFSVAISDSLYVPGKPPGEITAQNPAADSRVKEGRTLYFTVTKNNPDIIRLPDLAGGDDYDLYSRKLSRLGLKPRIVARVPDPRLSPNTIVAVIYRNDTITNKIRRGDYSMEMGATVDFVVSEQVTLTVAMPNCECQTFGAAKFLLQASSLSLGSIIKDATVTDAQTAYVWRQSPRFDPNTTMRVGEQVDLYLTQQRPQQCAGQPEQQ
ncbi:MAG TPA: PASTA domain-containing protein [Saprospiraceae bacterium]|nr:PASTA domain-containing protein [Saprospiraceae bacterium]HNG88930.1 PASTA domain-containing protein [Saprospiraceae bacterium]